MSIESDAASHVAGVYTQGIALGAQVAIKVGEGTIKLTGKALKELIEFIAKSIRQDGKNGRLLLTNMLTRSAKEGKTLSMIRITSEEDFNKLAAELKSHGVTFAKARGKDCFDVLVFEEDAPRINIIIEKLKLNSVEKITEVKAEQANDKEDIFADGSYYEKELPFDDDDIIEYENLEEFEKDFFGKDKEKERGDKEHKVPTKDRNGSSQPEKKSEKEKQGSNSHKESTREVISNKKKARAEKSVESPAKPVAIAKDLKGVDLK